MLKPWLIGALAVGTLLYAACSDSNHPASAPPGMAGSGGTPSVPGTAGKSGSTGNAAGESSGGSGSGAGGDFGDAGASADGGSADAGSAGTSSGGTGSPPIPPVGDPPICVHDAVFVAGAPLAISGAGDDLLQAITPDEHSIAWKSGDQFFVADRSGVEFPFEAPLAVPGSAEYSAVTLSADGLKLIAVRKDLRVVEMARESGQAFDDATVSDGDFELFNGAIAVDPTPGKVLTDAVLSADGESFFHSYFLDDGAGSGPTVQESGRSAGLWTLAGADLGPLLYRTGAQRRVPTGVSSDSLTLFYRDEVEGDFRAAWRVNTQEPFDYAEVVSVGSDIEAAAPSSRCSRLYYSAPGTQGLDIFVGDVAPP